MGTRNNLFSDMRLFGTAVFSLSLRLVIKQKRDGKKTVTNRSLRYSTVTLATIIIKLKDRLTTDGNRNVRYKQN